MPNSSVTPNRSLTAALTTVALLLTGAIALWTAMSGLRFVLRGASPILERGVVAFVTGVLGVMLAVGVARVRHDLKASDFGLELSRRGAWEVVVGAVFWSALAVAAVGLALALGVVRLEFSSPGPSIVSIVLGQALLVFMLEALPEELLFRGVVLSVLRDHLASWSNTLVQAATFTVFAAALGFASTWIFDGRGVLPDMDRLILFYTMGVTLALVRFWRGSVWTCVGFHLAFQTVAQLFLTGRLGFVGGSGPEDLATIAILFWAGPIVTGGLGLSLVLVRGRHGTTSSRTAPRVG